MKVIYSLPFRKYTIPEIMITEAEKREILARAYVPEHVVDIMTLVSGGDPFSSMTTFAALQETC